METPEIVLMGTLPISDEQPLTGPAIAGNGPKVASTQADEMPSSIPASARDFHMKEFELLKQQRRELVDHGRKLELAVVAAIAAFYTWYLSASTVRSPNEALWIPVLMALLGALRSWSVLRRLEEIAEYIRVLEASLAAGLQGMVGWETHRRSPERASSVFVFSATVYWVTVCIATVFAAFKL